MSVAPAPAYKAILFDLDGTLLDTLTDLADSMNAVLTGLNLPVHPREAYRYFVGDGIEILASRVLPAESRTPEMIERCASAMRLRYQDHWADKSAPYQGIPELLGALSGRPLHLNILSNKPEEFTRVMVNHFLPAICWTTVRGARPDTPKKPDPTAALAIAAQLAIEPQRFLYVGDTNTDMQTANRAGMCAVGVLWGFRTRQELESAGAKVVIEHPLDLLELVS